MPLLYCSWDSFCTCNLGLHFCFLFRHQRKKSFSQPDWQVWAVITRQTITFKRYCRPASVFFWTYLSPKGRCMLSMYAASFHIIVVLQHSSTSSILVTKTLAVLCLGDCPSNLKLAQNSVVLILNYIYRRARPARIRWALHVISKSRFKCNSRRMILVLTTFWYKCFVKVKYWGRQKKWMGFDIIEII